MASVPEPTLTPQQYLERERAAEFKSEFYRGEMFAMAGASYRHNKVTSNVLHSIRSQFASRPCEVFGSDMRVHLDETGLYTYPDVVAWCGEPEFLDGHFDTLLNPQVIVEVLSDSTANYDRGEKAQQYRTMPSLRELVLVDQARPYVELYRRNDDGSWQLVELSEMEQSLELTTIDCRIPLAEIYERVQFEDAGEP